MAEPQLPRPLDLCKVTVKRLPTEKFSKGVCSLIILVIGRPGSAARVRSGISGLHT
jgi:hypothetical protein